MFKKSLKTVAPKNNKYSKLIKNKYMKTLPDTILKYNIDGYFAAYLKKIK